MTWATSVAYARECADLDEWIAAAEAYRTSRGAPHVVARHEFWPLLHAERMRLRRERTELREAAMRAMARRAA